MTLSDQYYTGSPRHVTGAKRGEIRRAEVAPRLGTREKKRAMAELSLSGAYTALVTPFTPDGSEVDFVAFEKHLEAQIAAGISGLVPCGTTGEAPTLSDGEQRELITRSKRVAKGRALVVAGTGSNSTKKSIESAKAAVEAGADVVMIVMPYYSKPTQEGLFQHVCAIAKATPAPIVLYNIPGRSVVELSVDSTLRVLDACPNVVGIKDATGHVLHCQELISRAKRPISVLSGDDVLTVPMMSVGATGVISVTSNVYPKQVSELVRDALAGRVLDAGKKHVAMFAVHKAMFSEANPSPVKAALELKGRMSSSVRLPLVEASAECRARLSAAMAEYEAS
jgi:4-hydroxy-tetrahydrodipicolinate synthase